MTLFRRDTSRATNAIKKYSGPMEFALDMTSRAIRELPNVPKNKDKFVDIISLTLTAMEDYAAEVEWINK